MNMNKQSLLALAMLAASTYGFGQPSSRTKEIKSPRDENEYNKSKGLKVFTYGDKQIFALNQRSADKKAKSLGLI
jgi:hypothetical protein